MSNKTPKRLQDWVEWLGERPLPRHPALAPDFGAESALLTWQLQQDPAAVVGLLRRAAAVRHRHLDTRLEGTEEALIMLGRNGVAACWEALPPADRLLHGEALTRYLRCHARAVHAARQAEEWVRLRHDRRPSEVADATLIRHMGELMLRAHAPERMAEVDALATDARLDADAETAVLGFTLQDLAISLGNHWRLPYLALEDLSGIRPLSQRSQAVLLALRLARVAEDPRAARELPVLIQALSHYMGDSEDHARRVTLETAQVIHEQTPPPTGWSPTLALDGDRGPSPSTPAPFCLAPRADIRARVAAELEREDFDRARLELLTRHRLDNREAVLISLVLTGLHEGLGLNRTLFLRAPRRGEHLQLFLQRGALGDPLLHEMTVTPAHSPLLREVIDQAPAYRLCQPTQGRDRLPEPLQRFNGGQPCLLASLRVNDRLAGLFYADRHLAGCGLDGTAAMGFRHFCEQAGRRLQRLADEHHHLS
ncbi:HDOD domain-containing protein [Alkalilimnicola ehrlichii MLHE-1]|uniref:HDOD domain-containing protein n=1 Tax=Alkalilimnicola ehrlichii (strain ATCC BAA-1101 / DSM 17681 / MLHE-1) TaxID=187272 RepID=Q0A8I2_ALKEH|nr:HDOD domain-containing protein [Alkalilimnicola ehrlichii]ABI56855.1 hypothetical protein Mlg_1506 [Alkalilimnicola ehrlichii MLHE-1]